MKKNYIFKTFSLLFLSVATYAQPTLTSTNTNPVPGDVFYNINAGYPGSEGAAGANINWDFSALTAMSIDTVVAMAPSATPYGSSFPAATVSLHSLGTTSYDFYISTTDSLYMIGTQNSTSMGTYSDPFKLMKYPCTFNSTYTDNFYSVITNSITTAESGVGVVIADAYGSLQLPYGTYNNVLRIKQDLTFYETTGSSTDTIAETLYQWYLPGTHQAVLIMGSATVPGFGTFTFCSYMAQQSSGINESYSANASLDLFPNPSSNFSNVSYSISNEETVTLSIINILGDVVFSQNKGTLSSGSYSEMIDLKALKPGIYFVQLKTPKGFLTKKLIVE